MTNFLFFLYFGRWASWNGESLRDGRKFSFLLG
jgi:hypothetical protein